MPSQVTGGYDHAKDLIYMVISRLQEAAPEIAEAVLTDAASRAPTPEEEYNELNAESGQKPLVPMGPDGNSADTDGRTRFVKPMSTYLKYAIKDIDRNFQLGTKNRFWYTSLKMRFGRLSYLEKMAKFKYRNLAGKGGTIENEVGPYFKMFEGGTAGVDVTTFTVEPRGDWLLRPGEGSEGIRKSMVKSISGRFMFDPFSLQLAASSAIKRVLSTVGPGQESTL